MKRLVVCADGTWNLRDQVEKESGKRRPTNVTKLARAVNLEATDGTAQVVCYHNGVGTGGPLDQLSGGAFGHGMEANIRELYRFILYNYQLGDELYLFGFSRGAFTIRSLVGFLSLYGLVRKEDDYYVPELYECYERGATKGAKFEALFRRADGSQRIHQALPCPKIKFVGVFDTVGALGAPGFLGQMFNRSKYKYHNVDLNDQVEYAVHALAIDERRSAFLPTLWTRPSGWKGTLIQAWFAGVHSNIGGGYKPDGLANEALHWVASHAESCGLSLNRQYLAHFEPWFDSTLNDSMTLLYRTMGTVSRSLGNAIAHGECLHRSVVRRVADARCAYAPHNLNSSLPVVDTLRVETGEEPTR